MGSKYHVVLVKGTFLNSLAGLKPRNAVTCVCDVYGVGWY